MADPISTPGDAQNAGEYADWEEARASLDEMMRAVRKKERRRLWWRLIASIFDVLLSLFLLVVMVVWLIAAANAADQALWDEATYRLFGAFFAFYLARHIRISSS
jgi:hypothetical protein